MSHFWINLSLEQEDQGNKGGQRGKKGEKTKHSTITSSNGEGSNDCWPLLWQLCYMRGAELGFLIGWRSECAVFCEKVFWKGEAGAGGVKTLKAKVNFLSKNFLEEMEMRGFKGGTWTPLLPFSLSQGFQFSFEAVQLNNITFYIIFI